MYLASGRIPPFFYVDVDSEWKGTCRICFRIRCCAWSEGSEFCSGAVHRTLEPEAPLVPLTESFTPEFSRTALGRALLQSRRWNHSRRSRTVEWVLCGTGRVVGSWPFWSCGIKARRSSQFPFGMGRDDSVAPSRIELTRRVIIVSVGRGLVRTTCRRRCPPWVSPDEYKRVRFFLQLATCGRRCGVIVADCCGSGREFLNVL